ncbi:MAG: alpha/beta fold hydrolase [Solirubrobacteraceae bacterium]
MLDSHAGASIPEVTHHHATLNGTDLHYVRAGSDGTPVLLVHGFPETWWAFHKLIPTLAAEHRVIAVDLPGFGDSGDAPGDCTSATAAATLRLLIDELDLGAVNLTGQDISGPTTFRLAAVRPELIRSFTAIETGLPGFGLEMLADVTHGGAWHIGVLAAPGIPELLLAGREREFLAGYAYPAMCATTGAITGQDVDEFTRTFARPDGFRGASGLYRSMLNEGEEIQGLVAQGKLQMPVLAVGAGSGDFSRHTMTQVAEDVSAATLADVGHYAAMEAPEALAQALLDFYRSIDD